MINWLTLLTPVPKQPVSIYFGFANMTDSLIRCFSIGP